MLKSTFSFPVGKKFASSPGFSRRIKNVPQKEKAFIPFSRCSAFPSVFLRQRLICSPRTPLLLVPCKMPKTHSPIREWMCPSQESRPPCVPSRSRRRVSERTIRPFAQRKFKGERSSCLSMADAFASAKTKRDRRRRKTGRGIRRNGGSRNFFALTSWTKTAMLTEASLRFSTERCNTSIRIADWSTKKSSRCCATIWPCCRSTRTRTGRLGLEWMIFDALPVSLEPILKGTHRTPELPGNLSKRLLRLQNKTNRLSADCIGITNTWHDLSRKKSDGTNQSDDRTTMPRLSGHKKNHARTRFVEQIHTKDTVTVRSTLGRKRLRRESALVLKSDWSFSLSPPVAFYGILESSPLSQ